MTGLTLHAAPYGRPAVALLRDRIAAAKADDPLRPVTVVVPTNYVGVSTRRLLADGALGAITDRGVGIAGLTLVTIYRLAELLGAPRLSAQGRRPVSTPVVAAAIRRVVQEVREPFRIDHIDHHRLRGALRIPASTDSINGSRYVCLAVRNSENTCRTFPRAHARGYMLPLLRS
jgi:hypothetical protein